MGRRRVLPGDGVSSACVEALVGVRHGGLFDGFSVALDWALSATLSAVCALSMALSMALVLYRWFFDGFRLCSIGGSVDSLCSINGSIDGAVLCALSSALSTAALSTAALSTALSMVGALL